MTTDISAVTDLLDIYNISSDKIRKNNFTSDINTGINQTGYVNKASDGSKYDENILKNISPEVYNSSVNEILSILSKYSTKSVNLSEIMQTTSNSLTNNLMEFPALKKYMSNLSEQDTKNLIANWATQEAEASTLNVLFPDFLSASSTQNTSSPTSISDTLNNISDLSIVSYLNTNSVSKMYSYLKGHNQYVNNEKIYDLTTSDIMTSFYEYFA